MIKLYSKINCGLRHLAEYVHASNELIVIRTAFTETMLGVCQNIICFKMRHNILMCITCSRILQETDVSEMGL